MEKMWNVYLIHHSHTDIGYTERQEKIMRYHYDFIRQRLRFWMISTVEKRLLRGL